MIQGCERLLGIMLHLAVLVSVCNGMESMCQTIALGFDLKTRSTNASKAHITM